MAATFIDFDLRIFNAGPGVFLVTAQTPNSGLAQGMLDWAALSDDDFLADVELIRDEPLDYSSNEARFRRVGETLFKALFPSPGQVYDHFYSVFSQQVQASEDTYLRLRMDINENASAVAALPWEFMVWNDGFLAAKLKMLVTRQLLNLSYGNIRSLKVEGAPKVLVVIPRGSGLETEVEEAHITEALSNAGIPFDPAKDILKGRVTLDRTNEALAASEYNILHFIGHGEFKEEDGGGMRGSLRFNHEDEDLAENEKEDERWVKDTDLRAMLETYNRHIKLVVLNACHGAEMAERRSGRGFIGTAPAILKAEIPAVIAMQYAIYDDVAVKFAQTFYKRLTQGEWAGQVDTALTLARNACLLNFPKDRGFATPILYLRSQDGIIFEISTSGNDHSSVRPLPNTGNQPDPCPPPPKPPEEILHEYRYDDPETMLATVKAAKDTLNLLKERIASLTRMAEEYPLQEITIRQQLERTQPQVSKKEKDYEEKLAVLRWKLHEACLEREKLAARLEGLKAEQAEMKNRNAYVPFSLKNDISETGKKVRDLDDVIREGAAYL